MCTTDDAPDSTVSSSNPVEALAELVTDPAALLAGEKQEGCDGNGSNQRCLRVFRRSGAPFRLKTISFGAGTYATYGITNGASIYVARAALQAGLTMVTIDNVSYGIQDNQPPDNCG